MSGDFYGDMRSIATEVLTAFAQGKIQYVLTTPGSGPADDPGPASEAIYDVVGTVKGVKFTYINGTSILASDQQITIPVQFDYGGKLASISGVENPDIAGFFLIDGKRYKIIKVIAKPAAGVPVAYTVIVRK